MMYLIWSNEHNGWWRPKQCGYTNHRELAGRYTLEEATEIVYFANKHIQWKHTPDEKIPVPKEAIVPVADYDEASL